MTYGIDCGFDTRRIVWPRTGPLPATSVRPSCLSSAVASDGPSLVPLEKAPLVMCDYFGHSPFGIQEVFSTIHGLEES